MPRPQEPTPAADGHVRRHGDLTQSVTDPQASTGGQALAHPAATLPSSSERYAVLDEIARGGMGVIYRATDTAFGREVAVKVLHERFAPDSGAARRFADEARITGQLQHPGIPPAHDVETLPDGRPLLALKLIKGQTLEALLAARPDLAAERGRYVAVFEAVCQAIAYAHSRAVIHRDLKPANVMVGAFGEVQVMDWGLAKVLGGRASDAPESQETAAGTLVVSLRDSDGSFTQVGSVLGTPAFMPPEQAIGAVGKVDERSDVFGLGGILAVILTGQPPFAGSSVETSRLKATQGQLGECFARLDASGADPELLALCRRCLAPLPAERPADAGEVALAVAEMRQAADERARRAELDRVRIEGEQATAQARAAERRKRRRLALLAGLVLVVAALGGLRAVLAVQRRSNADLEAKNQQLAQQQAEVEARFALAQRAIATFHTGVSEDALLQNDDLKELRTTLLKQAAGFYSELERLLEGKADVKSRRLLAEGYFQLGQLTDKVGDKREALAVHRQALAVRRELAAAPGADAEARLDVARSLGEVAWPLRTTGDTAGALAAHEEQRDLAAAVAAEAPSDEARAKLAHGLSGIGAVLSEMGKLAEALEADERALEIRQGLADDSPAVTQYQRDLAHSHLNIARVLWKTGKMGEALKALETAREIQQRLADAKPAVTDIQRDLAHSHGNIGLLLSQTGKTTEALKAHETARDIWQSLADAHPAVTQYQSDLALAHINIAFVLWQTGKLAEALRALETAREIQQRLADAHPAVPQFQSALAMAHINFGAILGKTGKTVEVLRAYETARGIQQRLADAHPAVPEYQSHLALSHHNIAWVLSQTGKPAEALKAYETARDIRQKLADGHPAVPQYQNDLALSHGNIGLLLSQTGKPAEALKAHERARAIRQRLADANPSVTDFQRDLAHSHINIAQVLSQTGKPAEALGAYETARDLLQKLADANPTVPDFQSDLAWSQYSLGRLLARQGRFEEAFASLDQAQARCRRLADSHPQNALYLLRLGYSHAYRGAAHVRAAHPVEAAADLRRALALWDKDKAPDAEDRFERARALALLAGLGGEAKSGVTTAEAAAFADQAVAALQHAVKAGWAEGNELKEPDFDALRKRDDFQKLVTGLEGKGK
jgi:tetratricopeptide (TPR) repeat protein